MAYLAFYRMFRPDTFERVVRQEHIIQILKNQIATDRIGHAYLFCGPRGTGKTTVARIFAKAINCKTPNGGSPCGRCETCRALAEASNLDVVEIDAASNNGVDEMRDLREKVQYPPVSAKYKVYIIDEVHMLTDSAFNALLKTLEEPPKHAVFIMATTEPHKIPATILSRCMRFDFKLLPQEDLEEHLKGILQKIGKEYEEEAVSAIARAGAGSDRDMLSLADMCVSFSSGKLTYDDVTKVLGSADFYETGELCEAVLGGDNGASLSKLEKILSEGKSIGVLIKDCLNFLNRCTIAKMCRDAEKILSLPQKMFEYVKGVGERADGHRLLRVTEIFAKAENDMKYSTSPRILLETAVVKASMPQTDYNIDNLIARINELEEKLNRGVPAAPVARQVEVRVPETPTIEEPPIEEPVFFDEPIFEAPAPPKREEKKEAKREPSLSEPSAPVAAREDFKVNTFGKFLRALRKANKNPVLFVMCQDLHSSFEGDTFLLSTDSEVVYKSLTREEHTAALTAALASIGVSDFKVTLAGSRDEKKVSLTESVKRDFPDIKIEER